MREQPFFMHLKAYFMVNSLDNKKKKHNFVTKYFLLHMKVSILFIFFVVLAPVFSSKASNFMDTLSYNYFSPNGDSINDSYFIENLEKYRDNSFSVFNRWGDLVFYASPYSNNPNNEENKTFVGLCNQSLCIFGKELPEGAYFYQFEYKFEDKPTFINGKLILKR